MADSIEKLKRKMLEKLRDAGAPEIVSDAVDLLTPDDITELGIAAAASIIPGGTIVRTAGKAASKAGKAIAQGAKTTGKAIAKAAEKDPAGAALTALAVPYSGVLATTAVNKREKKAQEIQAIQNKYKQQGEHISWEDATDIYEQNERDKFKTGTDQTVESNSKYRGQKITK